MDWYVFSVLPFVTNVMSLVANTMAAWQDLPNQVLLFVVVIPPFECGASLNIDIFIGFIRKLWVSIRREKLARFIAVHWQSNARLSRLHVIGVFALEIGFFGWFSAICSRVETSGFHGS
jgi:hypothetical protein